tara:strand:- start:6218 stop:6673 length:456 start_codon:yes stop_codon:yes gene_type:complete
MRHYRLTNQERAGSGFTDQFVIEGKELTAAAATQTIALTTETNAIVDDVVVVRLDEKITGPAGTVKVEIGTTADPNYHCTLSADLKAAAAGALTGSVSTSTRAVTVISSSTAINAKFTEGGSNQFDATTNAGQVSVFMRIVRSSDLGYDQS